VGDAEKCVQILIKSKRIAEAAFFARAYCPSRIPSVINAWDESLQAKKLPF
jgi:coatomer subunit beta'